MVSTVILSQIAVNLRSAALGWLGIGSALGQTMARYLGLRCKNAPLQYFWVLFPSLTVFAENISTYYVELSKLLTNINWSY